MIEFVESRLNFSFSEDHWKVIQYDEKKEYNQIKNSLSGTKAVDFLCIYKNASVVMFEVKNFNGYPTPENERKFENGMDVLSTEIAQKVKDTIAGVMGICRNSEDSFWAEVTQQILNKEKPFTIIAWIEEDLGTEVQKQRKRSEMTVRINKLKKKLSWLTTSVLIENIEDRSFMYEGLNISILND